MKLEANIDLVAVSNSFLTMMGTSVRNSLPLLVVVDGEITLPYGKIIRSMFDQVHNGGCLSWDHASIEVFD